MSLQIWLYWIAGVALAGAGAFLVCWGLFSDRFSGNRTKRRCARCWYDMASVAGLKCPECGRSAKNEKELRRARRRWFLSAGGIALFVMGVATHCWVIRVQHGWNALLPLSVQVRIVPLLGAETVLLNAAYGGQPAEYAADAELRNRVIALAEATLTAPNESWDAKRHARTVIMRLAQQIDENDRERAGLLLVTEYSMLPEWSETASVDSILLLLGQDRALAEIASSIGLMPNPQARLYYQTIEALKPPFSSSAMQSMADIVSRTNQNGRIDVRREFPWKAADAFYARLAQHLDAGDPDRRQAIREFVERHFYEMRDAKSMFATRILQDIGLPYR